MATLERFGVRFKKVGKKTKTAPLEEFDEEYQKKVKSTRRAKKAVRIGEETEKRVMEKLGLVRNKNYSPDLVGEIDGKPVGVEVKHSLDNTVLVYWNQLEKVNKLGNTMTLDNIKSPGKAPITVTPYYAFVFTNKAGKSELILVPTSKLMEIGKNRTKKSKWGMRGDKRRIVTMKETYTRRIIPEEDERIREKIRKVEEKMKRLHFIVKKSELEKIAEKKIIL